MGLSTFNLEKARRVPYLRDRLLVAKAGSPRPKAGLKPQPGPRQALLACGVRGRNDQIAFLCATHT